MSSFVEWIEIYVLFYRVEYNFANINVAIFKQHACGGAGERNRDRAFVPFFGVLSSITRQAVFY